MLLILLALLALLGMPLFAVIALGALIAFNEQGLNMTLVVMEFQRIGELPVLVALPLFTFAGVLLSHSKTPERLVDLTRAMFGWMPGGLAILGLGLFTAGSSMGVLFAPSLPLILYAVVAQQVAPGEGIRIEELFLAGILPGLLMLMLMAGWAMRTGFHLPKDETPRPDVGPSLNAALWELPLPFVVLGGIYGGYLLVIEAAVVTAAWVIVTLVAVRRDIEWRKLPGIIAESMVLVGAILVVLGVSMASTNIMIDTQVPQRLFESVEPWISNKYMFLVMINILLLIVGMILDIFAALVIMAPLIIPIALAFGVDPVHLGIIFLANLQIGYCTPPVGINLFLASHRFSKDILVIYRSTLPFLGWLLVALLIITWWPGLSLWLAGRM